MRENVNRLRDINDVKVFKDILVNIIETNIKAKDKTETLTNWVEFSYAIDNLYEDMNKSNKDVEKLGITMVGKENSLVFMLKYKMNAELRAKNAKIGYGEMTSYNIRLLEEVYKSGLECRILELFDKLNELEPSEDRIAFKSSKEILGFLNVVNVWSELEKEKNSCDMFIVEYPCKEGYCCMSEGLFDGGLILANNKYKHGKEYELLRCIGMRVSRYGVSIFNGHPGMQEAVMEGYGAGLASVILVDAGLGHLDMGRYYNY